MKNPMIVAAVATGLVLAGCAGRDPNPVFIQQYGDREKSCETLEVEISQIEQEIQRLVPQTNKTGKNVALGVTGVFLIVPLFFMDLSQAERIEVEAYRQRYNHLVIIATEKGCSKRETIAPFDAEAEEATEEDAEDEGESAADDDAE